MYVTYEWTNERTYVGYVLISAHIHLRDVKSVWSIQQTRSDYASVLVMTATSTPSLPLRPNNSNPFTHMTVYNCWTHSTQLTIHFKNGFGPTKGRIKKKEEGKLIKCGEQMNILVLFHSILFCLFPIFTFLFSCIFFSHFPFVPQPDPCHTYFTFTQIKI